MLDLRLAGHFGDAVGHPATGALPACRSARTLSPLWQIRLAALRFLRRRSGAGSSFQVVATANVNLFACVSYITGSATLTVQGDPRVHVDSEANGAAGVLVAGEQVWQVDAPLPLHQRNCCRLLIVRSVLRSGVSGTMHCGALGVHWVYAEAD